MKVLLKRVYRFIKHRIRKYTDGKNITVEIKYNHSKGILYITSRGCFEDRDIKTIKMFTESFEQAKKYINNSFKISITCDDYSFFKRTVMAYSKADFQSNVIAIPDYSFVNWKECGINDYDECCDEILNMSKKPPMFDKLFWIGNVATHLTRETLCKLSLTDDRIEAIGMNWREKGIGSDRASKYVSLPDHTQYKYLIDIQGCGWSCRTKFLMFSGRPLFLVDRKWKEYWYKDIQPYVHYIPVKEDLSDLSAQLDWAESHPNEAEQIASNAQNYAINNLRHKNAIDCLTKILIEYANREKKK